MRPFDSQRQDRGRPAEPHAAVCPWPGAPLAPLGAGDGTADGDGGPADAAVALRTDDPHAPLLVPLEPAREARPRLLVIDDQPVNIQLLYQLFAGDCEMYAATDGTRGLALCIDRRPDLVLLDVVMPGIDGYETCRRLKADPRTADIPVIYVTGHDDQQSESQAFASGAVDYIRKPLNPPVVRARVRTHLLLRRQAEALRRMALTDGLTGTFNRRYFSSRLDSEVRRSDRSGSPLGLMMIDADHFKRYNDRYGHLEGDDCLRLLSQALASALMRPADTLCRYGGEEFACILPDTDAAGLEHVARNIRQRVRALGIAHDGGIGGLMTVSLGGAVRPARAAGDGQALLQRADAALYRAKSHGRDRAWIDGVTAQADAAAPG